MEWSGGEAVMPYDVVILSFRRPENLPAVVDAVRNQAPAPGRVFVWHNAPSCQPVAGAVNVTAEENFRCRARHALALLSTADAVVFLDDDVLLTAPDALAPMLAALEKHPGAVVGPEGRRCLRLSAEMYWGADSARIAHRDGAASVVKGKIHAARRETLAAAFARRLPEAVWTEDDIVLCAGAQIATGEPARVVAGMQSKYRNLSDDKGNEARPEHFAVRNAACQHMAGLGWDALRWTR